jgi:hypothetical protein
MKKYTNFLNEDVRPITDIIFDMRGNEHQAEGVLEYIKAALPQYADKVYLRLNEIYLRWEIYSEELKSDFAAKDEIIKKVKLTGLRLVDFQNYVHNS